MKKSTKPIKPTKPKPTHTSASDFNTTNIIFNKKIHFVGIGGIGMSAIAQIVHYMGHRVSGSDINQGETAEQLKKIGITVYHQHQRKNVTKDIDILVTSTAISPANEEILEAKERKIPIMHRGEMLAEIMRLKKGIAVAGTHGKTTTTSLISDLFYHGNLSPTTMIGGKWSGIDSNASLGKSDFLICESDESDGSFLKLFPIYSVVTNIDYDHMDYYKDADRLIQSFLEFIDHTPFFGKTFLCFENDLLHSLKEKISKPYASYGFNKSFDIFARKIKMKNFISEFEVVAYGKSLGKFQLNMAGEHNILNSLAAIGIALEVGLEVKIIKKILKEFKGVVRRMTQVGMWEGLQIIDDYGHHPTEIKATLSTLKKIQKYPVICAFQPHRYSRTLNLYQEFAAALVIADVIYLTDIYPAGELPIKKVNSTLILDAIKKIDPKKPVFILSNKEDLERHLRHLNHLNQEVSQSKNKSEANSKTIQTRLPKKGILITSGAGDLFHLSRNLVLDSLISKK